MEKIYNLNDESEFFKNLTYIYIQLSSEYPDDVVFSSSDEPINCQEILNFCVHHAECGENVYLIGFPRQVEVLRRPNTLFFMEKWCEFLDITDVDHALIVNIKNRNIYDSDRLHETMNHINEHFRTVVNFSFKS